MIWYYYMPGTDCADLKSAEVVVSNNHSATKAVLQTVQICWEMLILNHKGQKWIATWKLVGDARMLEGEGEVEVDVPTKIGPLVYVGAARSGPIEWGPWKSFRSLKRESLLFQIHWTILSTKVILFSTNTE